MTTSTIPLQFGYIPAVNLALKKIERIIATRSEKGSSTLEKITRDTESE